MTSTKQTRVEAGTALAGTMKSRCPVVINGTFEGEITAPNVEVSAEGTLLGTVKAQQLNATGTLGGKVDAEHIRLAGNVLDETHIKAAQLSAELPIADTVGPIKFGRCTLEIGGDPREPTP